MQDSKIIITLSGFKGSGKDTVARFIEKKMNSMYEERRGDYTGAISYIRHHSFADGVRDVNKILYGVPVESVTNKEELLPQLKRYNKFGIKTYRDISISTGEGVKRFAGQGIWADVTCRKVIRDYRDCYRRGIPKFVCVIPDLRFISELVTLRKFASKNDYKIYNFFVMRSDVYPDWASLKYDPNKKEDRHIIIHDFKAHSSEYEWCTFRGVDWTNVIANHGDMDSLNKAVDEILIKNFFDSEDEEVIDEQLDVCESTDKDDAINEENCDESKSEGQSFFDELMQNPDVAS